MASFFCAILGILFWGDIYAATVLPYNGHLYHYYCGYAADGKTPNQRDAAGGTGHDYYDLQYCHTAHRRCFYTVDYRDDAYSAADML